MDHPGGGVSFSFSLSVSLLCVKWSVLWRSCSQVIFWLLHAVKGARIVENHISFSFFFILGAINFAFGFVNCIFSFVSCWYCCCCHFLSPIFIFFTCRDVECTFMKYILSCMSFPLTCMYTFHCRTVLVDILLQGI